MQRVIFYLLKYLKFYTPAVIRLRWIYLLLDTWSGKTKKSIATKTGQLLKSVLFNNCPVLFIMARITQNMRFYNTFMKVFSFERAWLKSTIFNKKSAESCNIIFSITFEDSFCAVRIIGMRRRCGDETRNEKTGADRSEVWEADCIKPCGKHWKQDNVALPLWLREGDCSQNASSAQRA